MDGKISIGDQVKLASTGRSYTVTDVGIMHPEMSSIETLCGLSVYKGVSLFLFDAIISFARYTGQVGYITCGMKSTKEARVGDTIYAANAVVTPFPGSLFRTPLFSALVSLYSFQVSRNQFRLCLVVYIQQAQMISRLSKMPLRSSSLPTRQLVLQPTPSTSCRLLSVSLP